MTGGIAMTYLRQRMIEDMQLRGLSERTQEIYLHAVKQLAAHYQKPPDKISEQELRQYFLYLKNVKGMASSTRAVAMHGIKFLYAEPSSINVLLMSIFSEYATL
jgi:hypothetical protein